MDTFGGLKPKYLIVVVNVNLICQITVSIQNIVFMWHQTYGHNHHHHHKRFVVRRLREVRTALHYIVT